MKLGNNIAVAAILTDLNAARANDIIGRRIALLRGLGEDTRNTVSWRDAVAERGQFERAVSVSTWHLRTELAA